MKWTSIVGGTISVKEIDMLRKRKKSWPIWSEGYNAWDGPDKFPPHIVGYGEGDTFEEALENFLKESPHMFDEKGKLQWPYTNFYSNEQDARNRK